jgi:transposase
LEQRRVEAIRLLEKGVGPVEVARKVGVERRSVRRWKATYRELGREGLKAKPAPGRPPRLDGKRKQRLESYLLRGASAAGFPTELWTCPRVAQLIRRKFKIQYHVDHIGRLLRSMGWSPQRPERRARERDERAIQGWIKREWPRLKKKPAN